MSCSSLFKLNYGLMADEKEDYLAKCRELIEKQLGWGSSVNWQSQDFENLSDRIFEVTGVVLSASTLKRIWGKVQYNSKPNLSTLDTLARFAGFENWRIFAAAVPAPAILQPQKKRSSLSLKMLTPVLLITAMLGFAGFILLKKQKKLLRFQNIQFSSRPVAVGVPNTVVFEYDAGESNADSVFVQQSWDPKRRFKVDKKLHTYTSTYYMPGFYKAKLVLNDSVVKEHDLIIESDGWMGAIAHEPAPVYITKQLNKVPGQIGFSQQDFNNLHLEGGNTALLVTLANVSRRFNINSNNFLLRLDLQNTYTGANSPCLYTNIVVLGTDGFLLLPLGRKGCAGELNMMLGKKAIEGTTNDLSAFGVDFAQPVQLRCETGNGRIRILVNNKKAYDDRFEKDIGKIVGIRVNFFGTGFIRNFQLKTGGMDSKEQ